MQPNIEMVCRHMKETLKDVGTTTDDEYEECCIFKVHEQLRNVNEKCYLPEILAIGPYHHGQEKLQWMEMHKLRYMNSILQRKKVSLGNFVNTIIEQEKELRKYYAENIHLDGVKFTEMMILDGCFIIELVRKFHMVELRDKNDPIFKMDWILSSLQRDLILFENQLPFLVLCKLFDLIEAPNQYEKLVSLLCGFVKVVFTEHKTNEASDKNVKHLLELVHKWLMPPAEATCQESKGRKPKQKRRFHSASQLMENGVKFGRIEAKQSSLFKIEFKRGVFWIPTLTIEGRTECVLRNLMAYEQYSNDLPQYFVTNYVKFFVGLVDSQRDVEILGRYGIIDNWLGASQEVYNMFKNINKSIAYPKTNSYYDEVCERVNAYCNTSLRGRIARLRRNSIFTSIITESVFSV